LLTLLRGLVITPMPGTPADSSTHIDNGGGDDTCLVGMRALLDGIVAADPVVVAVVVVAVAVAAVTYVVRRRRGAP
jgi:hypothetical protein